MNNDYLTFAINEIKKSLNEDKDMINIGWDEINDEKYELKIPKKSWSDYLKILKEYAIEEECFEQINEIIDLENEIIKKIN
jgi:hypothetical protein